MVRSSDTGEFSHKGIGIGFKKSEEDGPVAIHPPPASEDNSYDTGKEKRGDPQMEIVPEERSFSSGILSASPSFCPLGSPPSSDTESTAQSAEYRLSSHDCGAGPAQREGHDRDEEAGVDHLSDEDSMGERWEPPPAPRTTILPGLSHGGVGEKQPRDGPERRLLGDVSNRATGDHYRKTVADSKMPNKLGTRGNKQTTSPIRAGGITRGSVVDGSPD